MTTNFTIPIQEHTLLKTAPAQSLNINQLARDFREMLINRECISSLTTVSEFMASSDLQEGIKLFGCSDQITPNNFSQGLISDYNCIQITPNKNASFLTDDVDILKH